jgi:hypothetical protein
MRQGSSVYLTSVDDLLHSIFGLGDVQICTGQSKRVTKCSQALSDGWLLIISNSDGVAIKKRHESRQASKMDAVSIRVSVVCYD